MRFRNPCKKCLVKPVCTIVCDMLSDHVKTMETLRFIIIPTAAMITISMMLIFIV